MFFSCFSDKVYPEQHWYDVWLKEVFVASALADTYDLLGQLEQDELTDGLSQLLTRMGEGLPEDSAVCLGEDAWHAFLYDHAAALYEALERANEGGEGEEAFKPDGRKVTEAMQNAAFHEAMSKTDTARHFGTLHADD